MLYINVDVLLNIHKVQNELEMIINVTVDAPDLKTKCKCAVYEEMFLCLCLNLQIIQTMVLNGVLKLDKYL